MVWQSLRLESDILQLQFTSLSGKPMFLSSQQVPKRKNNFSSHPRKPLYLIALVDQLHKSWFLIGWDHKKSQSRCRYSKSSSHATKQLNNSPSLKNEERKQRENKRSKAPDEKFDNAHFVAQESMEIRNSIPSRMK